MREGSVTHGTFVIDRRYPASPERVFAAFADPEKKRRWFAEGRETEGGGFAMDFRVGGRETTRSLIEAGPFKGVALTNESSYQDIVPNRRIVMAYTMTLGDRRISASLVTVELFAADNATDLIFTDQGAYFEGADGPTMREAGWRQLLEQLARTLESAADTAA